METVWVNRKIKLSIQWRSSSEQLNLGSPFKTATLWLQQAYEMRVSIYRLWNDLYIHILYKGWQIYSNLITLKLITLQNSSFSVKENYYNPNFLFIFPNRLLNEARNQKCIWIWTCLIVIKSKWNAIKNTLLNRI